MNRFRAFLGMMVLLPGLPARASPPTTLRLVAYWTGQLQEIMEEVVREFNASQKDLVVQYNYVPFGELRRHLMVASTSGDPPDLAIIDNPDHAFFADAGVLADLTDRVRHWSGNGHFYPGPWNSTIYKGRQYGVPFTTNCLGLFYDKAALARAGVRVPQNWEELRTAAKKLSVPGRYGLAMGAIRSEEGTFQYLAFFLSAGADFSRLDSPAAVRSLEFLRSLITDGSMSPEVIGWTQTDVQKQFSAGKAAMAIDGPWSLAQLERDARDPGLQYGIAPFPRDARFATPLGGENLVITRQANLDAAWTFVEYLTSPAVMERFDRKSGFLPPRTDVLRDGGRWVGDPRVQVFIDSMPYAVPRGPHPRWPEFSSLVSGALQEALTGFRSPAAALAAAERGRQALAASPSSTPGAAAHAR